MPEPEIMGLALRRHRLDREITQEKLAQEAGISVQGYRNIEQGQVTARVETLVALCRALGIDMQQLVAPPRILTHVRFRSSRKLKRRGEVLARVSRWLEDYAFLEDLLGLRQEYRLRELEREVDTWQEAGLEKARRAAEAVRGPNALDLGGEPVRDIGGLLEQRGAIKLLIRLKIATPVERVPAESGFFGLSISESDGGPAIVVNTWERISVERWIFTAAHELGHLLLHRGAYEVERTEEIAQEEREANVFASYFLMPKETFLNEWKGSAGMTMVDRILKIKRIFRVSYSTVLYRLGELFPAHKNKLWPRFHLDYQRRYGKRLSKTDEPDPLDHGDFGPIALRSQEPDRLSPIDFLEDRLASLVRKAVQQDEISLSRGAEILDLPLPEFREWAASWRLDPVGGL